MVVGILLIIFSACNVLLFFLTIYLLFTPVYYYFIASFMFMVLFYLLISIMFFKYAKKQLSKEKNNLKIFELKKNIENVNGVNIIEFINRDNKWISKQEQLEFKLDNFIFKKSFIIARIIREVRYSVVSNQMKLSNLLNYQLKVHKIDNLVVRFVDNEKTKEFIVVKNYISKNTILSRAITKAKYFALYLDRKSYVRYMRVIEKINEKIYLDY